MSLIFILGATGSPGQRGAIGPSGSTGQRGPTGLTGMSGPAGSTGLPGPRGDTGSTGPTGTPGLGQEGILVQQGLQAHLDKEVCSCNFCSAPPPNNSSIT